MKVVHLVGGSLSGGAARGALWLHEALLELGIESRLVVQHGKYDDQTILSVGGTRKGKLKALLNTQIDRLPLFFYKNRESRIFSTGFWGCDVHNLGIVRQADIVHMHWINAGFVRLGSFAKMKKPIVWTMRDMWPFTGGCHYALDCRKYENSCGNCPLLKSHKVNDLSRQIIRKKSQLRKYNLHLVGISHWLADCAQSSMPFSGQEIDVIPNGIKSQTYFPVDKEIAKQALGIKTNKNILLLGAQNVHDFYKGFSQFADSLQYLDKEKYILLIFGNGKREVFDKLDFEYRHLGFLSDSLSLRLAYSAADVFVAPSIQEAFGKTLIESMACGTPVVAFNATGPADIVEHKGTGYLAEPYDVRDLARGIHWVTEDQERNRHLSVNALERVKDKFDIEVVVKQYCYLYKTIMKVST